MEHEKGLIIWILFLFAGALDKAVKFRKDLNIK